MVRRIDPVDRTKNARHIENAEARGDPEEVQIIKDVFAEWEREQGQERERLVCAVCGSIWLTPTSSGTARPHRRDDVEQPTWDTVRRLRKEINALQAELDRVLDSLEV